MSCVINIREVGAVKVLDCRGSLTLEEGARELRDQVHLLVFGTLDTGFGPDKNGVSVKVLINFTEVRLMKAEAKGELVVAQQAVKKWGGQLRVYGMEKSIADSIRIQKLNTLFEDPRNPATSIDVKFEEVALRNFQ